MRAALLNPEREIVRFFATRNAAGRLADAIEKSGHSPEISDARKFPAPLDPGSVHQGAAIEALPLDWGTIGKICAPPSSSARVVLLDRITDPQNVGAILRTSEAFGALAAIAPHRHSAPESGGLAKSASGALERLPYLRVRNLAQAMGELKQMGYYLIGLNESAPVSVLEALARRPGLGPVGMAFGAEGSGLRMRTSKCCDCLARIETKDEFATLNVSNAVAVSLYAASIGQSEISTLLLDACDSAIATGDRNPHSQGDRFG
ncbi:MAG: RNA methyltransferase [Albidovulum sp.]|nr:RNA methyltransferase [Albidovulum sp.]